VFDGVRYASRATDYRRHEADAIFYEAMEVVGVNVWQRSVIHAAVRTFGGKGWGS
jgi:hypothetical protein